jgi:hypothetical protein
MPARDVSKGPHVEKLIELICYLSLYAAFGFVRLLPIIAMFWLCLVK